jgi:hypothetical protein
MDNDKVTVTFEDNFEGTDRFRVHGDKGKFVLIADTAEAALARYEKLRRREVK